MKREKARPRRKQGFTEESARQFERYSVANAATVADALECGCVPYQDVFTFNRWIAQGFVVDKGQKGIRIPVVIESDDKDEDGNTVVRKVFKGSAVFCRHQVVPLKDSSREKRR